MLLLRLLLGTGTIFVSFILGALTLAYVGVNSPATLSSLLAMAREVKLLITGTGLDPAYNIWIEFFLEERQILFMFFTIAARIVIGLVSAVVMAMIGR